MDMETYRRQVRGARNKRNGKVFEEIVTNSCHYYFSQKTALIIKTPEPMQPIKSLGNGRFIAYYEKAAQPDYKGTLYGGRTVIFDAKHTESDRLKQEAVTRMQSLALNYHEGFGALCFVLVSFGFAQFYRIPWEVFKRMKEIYGRKYVMPSDLEQYKVQFIGGVIRFLEGERKALESKKVKQTNKEV